MESLILFYSSKIEDDKLPAIENKAAPAGSRKCYYPSKQEMADFKADVEKEKARDAATKQRLADAKKADEDKPKEIKREWNREFLYSDLIEKYKQYAGNVYHNPDFHLPPIITREKAVELVKIEREKALAQDHKHAPARSNGFRFVSKPARQTLICLASELRLLSQSLITFVLTCDECANDE